MKKWFSVVLGALLLLSFGPAVRAEEAVVPIGSREDMLLIAQNPAGSFALTDDIDMGGTPWTPLPFSGKLNGNGHTLYNLTVTDPGADTVVTYDGNHKEYETVFGGLFSVVTDAQIQKLNFVNAVVTVNTDQNCFLGTLAGYAIHSTIADCTVQARNHLTLTSVNAGVGGIVGFSVDNDIENCTVDAELVFTDVNKDLLCEEFLGGVYASGCGNVKECSVRMAGFAETYGYAHNGGVIGMIKLPRGFWKICAISRTTVDADISFFEITPSRRAYCDPLIGENLAGNCRTIKNKVASFRRSESKTPSRLSPEKCEEPNYSSEVTVGDCTAWGYTTHTCAGCGYSYRDSYTPPAHQYAVQTVTAATCTEAGEQTLRCSLCGHTDTVPLPPTGHAYEERVTAPTCTDAGERAFICANCGDRYAEPLPATGHTPGEWVLIQAPQVNTEGEEQRLCLTCNQVLERRSVPALPYIYAESVTLNETILTLAVGEEARLEAVLSPTDATEPTFTFRSSDETVVRVTDNGAMLAQGPGTATITCTSTDGNASAACAVTVSYTPWQWVKHYILFGWVWEG